MNNRSPGTPAQFCLVFPSHCFSLYLHVIWFSCLTGHAENAWEGMTSKFRLLPQRCTQQGLCAPPGPGGEDSSSHSFADHRDHPDAPAASAPCQTDSKSTAHWTWAATLTKTLLQDFFGQQENVRHGERDQILHSPLIHGCKELQQSKQISLRLYESFNLLLPSYQWQVSCFTRRHVQFVREAARPVYSQVRFSVPGAFNTPVITTHLIWQV